MQQGFFSKSEVKLESRSQGTVSSCYRCGLYKHVQSPKMEPYGSFKKRIMVIGEGPGKLEDKRGKPWQGKTGTRLRKVFEKLGIDLFDDCVSLNAVNCRTPQNRTPTGIEVNHCRDVKVIPAIKKYNPDIIILLGGEALKSFLDHRWKDGLGGITKWRGWTIPDKLYKAWVCPVYHPSYVERMESEVIDKIWEQDLKRAFDLMNVKLPRWPKPNIEFIEDLSVLDEIKYGTVTIDFETTGKKPHAAGHRIVTGAVAYDENNAYAFPMPKRKKDRQPFIRLLEDMNVSKIAANIKFEDAWAKERLKTEINNWLFDTMQAAHILDNRPGITSLKFQAYVNLGITGYDDEVSPYLRTTGSANNINRLPELIQSPQGMSKLLKYNGLDVIYEYRIAEIQMKKLNYDLLPF